MISFDAIIFDFDGVLLESELELNRLTAELLTNLGAPTTLEEALQFFTGLTGPDLMKVIENRLGGPVPTSFNEEMRRASARALDGGLEPLIGAVDFVRALPPALPRAVASSRAPAGRPAWAAPAPGARAPARRRQARTDRRTSC